MKRTILLLTLILSSCAPRVTLQPISDAEKTQTFAADADALWKAVVQVLTEQEYQIAVIDKDTGVITTEYKQLYNHGVIDSLFHLSRSEKLFLGDARVKATIMVAETGAVTCNMIYEYRYSDAKNAGKDTYFKRQSYGIIERQFFDAMKDRLP